MVGRAGKDKGKQGKVLGTVPGSLKVVVEGIKMCIRDRCGTCTRSW